MQKVTVMLSQRLQGIDKDELEKKLIDWLKSPTGSDVQIEFSSVVIGQPEVCLIMDDFGGFSGYQADLLMGNVKEVVTKQLSLTREQVRVEWTARLVK